MKKTVLMTFTSFALLYSSLSFSSEYEHHEHADHSFGLEHPDQTDGSLSSDDQSIIDDAEAHLNNDRHSTN